jgi:hypothetical protein
MKMTFEQFKASRRATTDLSEISGDEDKMPGYIYGTNTAHFYINTRPAGGWENGAPQAYCLTIERDGWLSDCLVALEHRLFAFACDQCGWQQDCQLHELASVAQQLYHDEYGSEAQIDADNAFHDYARKQFHPMAWEDFTGWCLKARGDEAIEEAVHLLEME